MAEEKHESGGIPETVVFLVGLFAVLGALWWMRGGPQQADGGPLLAPPPMLGEQIYNPSITTTTPVTP